MQFMFEVILMSNLKCQVTGKLVYNITAYKVNDTVL